MQAQIAEAIERRLRTSPLANQNFECVPFGDDEAPIRVYLFEDVLDELTYAASYATDDCYAVLTGGFGMEGDGGFIETTGFNGLEYGNISEAYDRLRATCDELLMSRNQTEDVVVGLFVNEKESDGRLTPEMMRQHMSLFNVPFQPLVVIDSVSGNLGVYVRPPQSSFENSAFWVVRGLSDSES